MEKKSKPICRRVSGHESEERACPGSWRGGVAGGPAGDGVAGAGELGLAGGGGGEQLEPAANLLLQQFQLAEGTAQQGVDS